MKGVSRMHKKGQVFGMLASLGVGIATLAIVLVVTFLILAQGKTQIGTTAGITVTNATQCGANAACNATDVLTNAVATIPGWVPLIVIASIGGALLGLVALFRRK